MEFTIGSAVFLSSLVLLAVLARIAAANPDPAILRGEFAPAMLSVLITSGLAIGLMMMAIGGRGYFGSPVIEGVAITVFAIVSIWIVARLFGRAPRDFGAAPSAGGAGDAADAR
ncbi:hypothetical protein LL06_15805 [Hoeflea sp. BAL378]|uniref:hypothetical protein n=1 Tax=Hoeflea sp. BAL378 TaxID=1547437 RepID=UPI0005146B2B|nr:hypothetical protein [Hoeflea sp. BAL378]KGF68572.1 hypothetical protein LL06_15805 [Hoeflea sp. BAL378]